MSNQILKFPIVETTFNSFIIAFYSSYTARSTFNLISCKSVFAFGSFTLWVFLSVKPGQSFITSQALFYLGQRSVEVGS